MSIDEDDLEQGNSLELEPVEPVIFAGRVARTDKVKAKILELRAKGLNADQIARAVKKPRTTVQSIIGRFDKVFEAMDRVDEFRKIKSDLLSSAQLTVLESSLTAKKLEKASLLAGMKAFEVLHKAERLERGLATESHEHRIGVSINLTASPPAEEETTEAIDVTDDISSPE